jgi:hypothetical protein
MNDDSIKSDPESKLMDQHPPTDPGPDALIQGLILDAAYFQVNKQEELAEQFISSLRRMGDPEINEYLTAMEQGTQYVTPEEARHFKQARDRVHELHTAFQASVDVAPILLQVAVTQSSIRDALEAIFKNTGKKPKTLDLTDLLFETLARYLEAKYGFKRQKDNEKGFTFFNLFITHTLPAYHRPGFLFGF